MEGELREGRSLAETPTWSVATVTTIMVFVCFLVERSIYWFGKWLKKKRRKALLASLEKIKEELMLLGLISLMLGQWARWISEICVDSSLFDSRFYTCTEEDFSPHNHFLVRESHPSLNETDVPPKGLYSSVSHTCPKIYSWRKWEYQAIDQAGDGDLQAKKNKVMRRQTTFAFHHASHPWSRNRVLIWMLCFLRQFKNTIKKSDYLALRLGFITNHKLPLSYNFHKYMVRSMEDEFNAIVGISWPLWGYAILCILLNVHGLNIYFWLSFIPVVLVMLLGTKLEHVVSLLALEIAEQSGPASGTQVKPRDGLFWFGKPEMILWLIQFVSFQNSFELATFIWSMWGFKQHACFTKNHTMVVTRLVSGVLVQFWCSYSTVPLSVIITQMGSKCKKALVAESVRDSLHSWCKRVKAKSKRSHTARSVCSLDDIDETLTVASLTLSSSSSVASLNEIKVANPKQTGEAGVSNSVTVPDDFTSFRIEEYISQAAQATFQDNSDTLADLFQKT
ncbi:MLO-like protein 4 isoform X2 [Silene latifolia]|uniref:MLO-like protein 4 isoform X2 n=1 Tax=Silene latifolia TaxID=37657 RepID=UPI003D772E19